MVYNVFGFQAAMVRASRMFRNQCTMVHYMYIAGLEVRGARTMVA